MNKAAEEQYELAAYLAMAILQHTDEVFFTRGEMLQLLNEAGLELRRSEPGPVVEAMTVAFAEELEIQLRRNADKGGDAS